MKKGVITAFVCLMCILSVTAVYSSAVGTDSDPLVSKSYVDGQVSQLKSLITTANQSGGGTESTVSGGYSTVYVPVGKKIMGGEGTELILRAGKGSVYITGGDGIADVTTGQNLKNGVAVTSNHLLVIPRNDGRGIKVSEAAWFLVKGSYTLD